MKKHLIILTFFVLCSATAKTQIIYTDFDPDTTLYVPNYGDIGYALPIKSDTTYDFGLVLRRITASSGGGKDIHLISNNQNMIAGYCDLQPYVGEYYVLEGDTIDASSIWRTYNHYLYYSTDLPWACIPPPIDLYWGLKIVDNTGTYYGWLRVSLTMHSITLKDFAYNSVPDQFIIAGQTQSNQVAQQNLGGIFSVTNQNSRIHISSSMQIGNINISIINTLGTQIVSDIMNSDTYTSPQLNSGIYLVRIQTGNQSVIKKVFVN